MDWETFWQIVIAVTVLQVITFIGARLLLGSVLRDVQRRLDDLEARVTALESGTPGTPPFVVGETFPDETNVGAGVIAPYPTKVVSTVTEFDGPGELVQDTIFNDLVKVRSDGWTFVNCVFRGPSVWTAGSNLVWVDQARVTPAGKPVFKYCDINPQTADTHWNGIGWKLYRLEECNIWGAIDCLAAFAREDDPDPRVHIEVLGCWLHDMAQFKPDVAGDRDVTHNDLIQCQGNDGPADDILLDGCRLDAYASTEQGSPQPPEHTQLAAVMMTPNQQDKVCLTLRRSWLTGGVFTFNATAPANAKSIIVLADNKWERPRNGVPAAAIAIDPTLVNRTLSNNVYSDDGSPVEVYSA